MKYSFIEKGTISHNTNICDFHIQLTEPTLKMFVIFYEKLAFSDVFLEINSNIKICVKHTAGQGLILNDECVLT
jgi:hypothetical protein